MVLEPFFEKLSTSPRTLLLSLACLAAFAIARNLWQSWLVFRQNVRLTGHLPGYNVLFHPHDLAAMFLPRWPGFNLGEQYSWRYKHTLFDRGNGVDVLSLVSMFPPMRTFVISDAAAIKYITAERQRFMKPLAIYAALGMYGMNVGITEGKEWTRHRRIVAGPAFAESTNEVAWNETLRTMDLCFDDWEEQMKRRKDGKREVEIESMVALTLKIALLNVSAAIFSHRAPWHDTEPEALTKGHTLSFRSALHGVLENVFYRMLLPDIAYKLPIRRLHYIDASFRELGIYLQEMIDERRASGSDARESSEGRRDLLGSLVHAHSDDEAKMASDEDAKARSKLTDSEVKGNIYVFLLAGHDTTAHTLAFTFALLALYPEVQQKMLDHINEVLPPGVDPAFDDFPKLAYVLAVFLETLRLYPSVVVIPKYSMVDTWIPVEKMPTDPDEPPQQGQAFIPAGGEVFLDAVALHYNPRHWGPDPSAFRPERFLDAPDGSYRWPREAFLGFSMGARSCLGQRFAQAEAVAILTTVVRRYEVLLREDVDGTAPRGETREAKRERVTKCKTVITLTPSACPFVLRERK